MWTNHAPVCGSGSLSDTSPITPPIYKTKCLTFSAINAFFSTGLNAFTMPCFFSTGLNAFTMHCFFYRTYALTFLAINAFFFYRTLCLDIIHCSILTRVTSPDQVSRTNRWTRSSIRISLQQFCRSFIWSSTCGTQNTIISAQSCTC